MTSSKTENTTAKAPRYIAYQVSTVPGANHWARIGAAWPHKDGNGFSIKLNGIPYDGRIALRVAPEKN